MAIISRQAISSLTQSTMALLCLCLSIANKLIRETAISIRAPRLATCAANPVEYTLQLCFTSKLLGQVERKGGEDASDKKEAKLSAISPDL